MDFAERSSMKQADLTPIESVSDKVKSVTLHARDTMVVSHQLDRVDICSTSGHSFAPYQRLLDKFREANADVLEHSAMIITENTIYFANIPFEDAVVRMQNPKGQVIDLRANKSSLNYVL